MKISRVLLVGGTHGNELIGVYLIKKFDQHPELIYRSSFDTLTLLGNPKAAEKCVRYIDKDLNRCFNFLALENEINNTFYEIQRAKNISHQFKQTGESPVDLIIDLHSTTANVGLMLILDNLTPFSLNLSSYLTSTIPALKIYNSATSGRHQDSLRSISNHRIGIEVGPLAHGTLRADLFQKTEALVHSILDYIEQHNSNTIALQKQSLTLYQYIDSIDYPRNEKGEIQAVIHSQLQFQDYDALNPGDPIFLTFDDEEILYQGNSTIYPIFINEAAYYEKKIAMYLTQKQRFSASEISEQYILATSY